MTRAHMLQGEYHASHPTTPLLNTKPLNGGIGPLHSTPRIFNPNQKSGGIVSRSLTLHLSLNLTGTSQESQPCVLMAVFSHFLLKLLVCICRQATPRGLFLCVCSINEDLQPSRAVFDDPMVCHYINYSPNAIMQKYRMLGVRAFVLVRGCGLLWPDESLSRLRSTWRSTWRRHVLLVA